MIELLESTPSTNALALDAARQGAQHGATWVADRQTEGRGRREVGGTRRTWFSPAGAGLYMSVLLRTKPTDEPPAAVTIAVGAAVCGVIRERFGVEALLKWPNDIVVGGRKLAGILTEASTTAAGVEAIVVGIGLNVNAASFPDELAETAISLEELSGHPHDRMALAIAVRRAIVDAADGYFINGLSPIMGELEALDATRGKVVQVNIDGQWISAESLGIAPDGGLRVVLGDDVHVVTTGEVRQQ